MFWCSVADGTLLGVIVLWPGLGPEAVAESQQGPKTGVRGSGFTTIGGYLDIDGFVIGFARSLERLLEGR